MNYRVLPILFCMVAALIFTGCSSDDQPTNPSSTNPGDSYYPVTKGSYWKYSVNGTIGTNIVIGDTIVNGQTYAVVVDQADPSGSRTLVREQDRNIYIRNAEYGFHEVLYAKTNAAIGEQWDFALTINGVQNEYEYRMVAKGITKTVNSREYRDVIQTHVTVYIVFNGQRIAAGTAETFLAKGVGVISVRLVNGQELTLLDYQIK